MGSRPVKGQKAQSIIDIEIKNRDTVKKRIAWLRKISGGSSILPDGFDALTLDTFCNYENKNLGFTKLSANTFKTHLAKLEKDDINNKDLLLETKDILSSLRRDKSSPKNTTPRTSKSETIIKYKTTINELEDDIVALTDDLVTLRIGYLRLLDTLDDIPRKDKVIRNAIKVHREAVGLRIVSNGHE